MPRNDDIINVASLALAESIASILADDDVDKAAAMTKTFEQCSDYLKANIIVKSDVSDKARGPREEDDSEKVTAKLKAMVQLMVRADPSKTQEQHLFSLLHTARGQQLARHLNEISKRKEEPQMDISKLLEITEAGLMAQVTRRDGESYAKSFSRKFEDDINFLKQWRDLTDAKHSMALSKGMASLQVTSVEVGNTNVADDSAAAVKLLSEMAEKQSRKFEEVFADPANKALANRTYTSRHRSSVNTDYLER
jgi:hypothetical protein